ncbi:MAG: heme exporter protein CcmD [Glaciecola sp.]
MGGRGWFVWLSYAIGLASFMVVLMYSVFERASIIKAAQKQQARVAKIMAARAAKKAVQTNASL